MKKSFIIVTLGCKVNQYESEYLRDSLLRAGYLEAADGEKAEIGVINTCLVTRRAAHQSRQAIRKAVREMPGGVVAVTGCYAQLYPGELSGINGVSIVAGNREKAWLAELILDYRGPDKLVKARGYRGDEKFEFMPVRRFSERARAYLKIQDGCRSFCSYCIVPYARGPYRSLEPGKALEMMEKMAGEGCREVVLTGIHLGKYGMDLPKGTDLCALLRTVGDKGLPVRIRLSSVEPQEVSSSLIDMMASESWICRHLHIPLQSGDSRILKKMGRSYTVHEFEGLIRSIHRAIPLAAIGVDVMTGFPGEGRSAHNRTVSLLRDLPVSYLHVFPFSPRKGTPAASFEGRPDPEEVKERSYELRELGRKKREAFYRMCVGKTFDVVVEGSHNKSEKYMKGTSDNYLRAVFPCARDRIGQRVSVRMDIPDRDYLLGSLVEEFTAS